MAFLAAASGAGPACWHRQVRHQVARPSRWSVLRPPAHLETDCRYHPACSLPITPL